MNTFMFISAIGIFLFPETRRGARFCDSTLYEPLPQLAYHKGKCRFLKYNYLHNNILKTLYHSPSKNSWYQQTPENKTNTYFYKEAQNLIYD